MSRGSSVFDWNNQQTAVGPIVLDWAPLLPPPPTTFPVTETWTVSNAPGTLNGDHAWVDYIGTHGWGVVSQAAQLENAGGISQGGRLAIDLGVDDYVVYVTVPEFTVTGGTGILSGGPCVRMQGTTALTFYALAFTSTNGVGALNLFRFLSGTQITLQSVPLTPIAGQRLGLRVKGTLLVGYVDGIPRIVQTDTQIPTGRYVGIQGFSNTAGFRIRLDTLTVLASRAPGFGLLTLRTLMPMTGLN